MLPLKNLGLDLGYYKYGAISLKGEYSPYYFINIGLSYSGNNIIGLGTIEFQKYPGISVKFRVTGESKILPAIAIGFSNQGASNYINDINRFEVLSPGVFMVLSKSFNWNLGYIGLHTGLNYSFENNSDERSLNLILGLEQSIAKFASLNMEYNFQFDEPDNSIYQARGMLNLSSRISVTNGVTFEIQLRDLLNNSKIDETIERQLLFEVIKQINL